MKIVNKDFYNTFNDLMELSRKLDDTYKKFYDIKQEIEPKKPYHQKIYFHIYDVFDTLLTIFELLLKGLIIIISLKIVIFFFTKSFINDIIYVIINNLIWQIYFLYSAAIIFLMLYSLISSYTKKIRKIRLFNKQENLSAKEKNLHIKHLKKTMSYKKKLEELREAENNYLKAKKDFDEKCDSLSVPNEYRCKIDLEEIYNFAQIKNFKYCTVLACIKERYQKFLDEKHY